jgi:hypothetical protein
MNSNLSYTSISANIRFRTFGFTVLVVCIFGTLGLDWLTARLNQSSFYISESFMFSSFWWLFVPGLLLQFRLAHRFKSIGCANNTHWPTSFMASFHLSGIGLVAFISIL